MNIDLQGDKKWTALMMACELKGPEVVELLLKAKANVNLRNDKKWTALMYACLHKRLVVVELLLKANADVDLQSNKKGTALMIACQFNGPEVVKLLLNANANVDLQNDMGWTALMVSSQHETFLYADQHANLLTLIASGQCNLNLTYDGETTALMLAEYFTRHYNAQALRAAQNGTFDYVIFRTKWEAYIQAAGIPTYTLEERRAFLKRDEEEAQRKAREQEE